MQRDPDSERLSRRRLWTLVATLVALAGQLIFSTAALDTGRSWLHTVASDIRALGSIGTIQTVGIGLGIWAVLATLLLPIVAVAQFGAAPGALRWWDRWLAMAVSLVALLPPTVLVVHASRRTILDVVLLIPGVPGAALVTVAYALAARGVRWKYNGRAVEVLIVISTLAALAWLIVPTTLGDAERARISRAQSDVAELAKAVDRVRRDTGSHSAACLAGLAHLTEAAPPRACGQPGRPLPVCADAKDAPCWRGRYLVSVTKDPWNNPYSVTVDPATLAIMVRSPGPDEEFGTEDDITSVK
jgi:type II secretory pathway pseudopilin PulG